MNGDGSGLPPNWEAWPAAAKASHLSLQFDRVELLRAVERAAGAEVDRERYHNESRLRIDQLARVLIALDADRNMEKLLNP